MSEQLVTYGQTLAELVNEGHDIVTVERRPCWLHRLTDLRAR